MKQVSLALALALAFAAPASAQSMDASHVVERLRAADTNHDGVVARQEFLTYRAGQFSRFDRNHDGFATADDIPSFVQRRAPAGMSPSELVTQFDANADGRVSRTEFVNGPTLAFDQVDANDDNVATEAEFEAALAPARTAR